MLKQILLKSAVFAAAVICMLLFSACGGETAKGNAQQIPTQTGARTENDVSVPSVTEAEPEPTDTAPVSPAVEEEPTDTTPVEAEPEPSAASPEVQNNAVVKINGGADEVGIYSVVVRLTEQAADKGTIEMVYYGAKGSPQENSIVNTFRIEYYKETAGTYEICTFSNGEVYQNHHHKDEMKVTNTFDATLRAGNVIISYTPDGGETVEVFRADADYFR